MAGLPSYPQSNRDTGGDAGAGPERDSPPSTPRWVKVFGIVALALVLVIAIIIKTGVGGQHGPARHMPSGDTPPSSLYTPPIQHGVQQP